MDVTLAGLTQALPDVLRPVAPLPVPAARVTGVHMSELPDPTPFLDGGELLLTTGLTLPDQALPLDAYAARLAGNGVSGLALGLGPVHDTLPTALPAACARAGLPLFSVPPHAPFQSVVREFWRQVGSGRLGELRDAMGSVHALVRAALTDEPGAGVVRALASATGGWSAMLDSEGVVLHAHPPGAARLATRSVVEVSRMRLTGPNSAATFPLDDDDVLAHSLDENGRVTGHLLVGCSRPLPPHARHLLLSACALLHLHAARTSPTATLGTAAPAALGLLVRLGHPDAAAGLATALGRPTPPTVRLLLVEGFAAPDLDAVTRGTGCLVAAGPTTLVVCEPHTADDVLDRLRTAAGDDSGTHRGVLTAATSWADTPRSLSRAEEALSRTPAGVFRDLTADRPMSSTVDDARLQALADHPRADLVATLAAYLRHRGRVEPAAASLGLHRNSMRHRLGLVRRILDVDIDDPDVAATWWLALRSRGLA